VYLSDIIRWKDTTMSNTTPEIADLPRRDFLRLAGIAAAATTTLTAGAMPARAATAVPAIRQIDAGVLNIGYLEYGPASGKPVLLFHGWPYDIHAFAEVAPLLAARGHRVIVPHLRGHGTTLFRSDATPRNAQQAALAADGIALMDALGISKAVVAGFDWGARTADIMAVLWPERCRAGVGQRLSDRQSGGQCQTAAPAAELQWWYQFYFATERGKLGYEANTKAFNRQIWHQASPSWAFDDATYDRSAASFANPDHVAIVIHNYRWRLGLAQGEAKYDAMEARLAAAPPVTIPAITLEGDRNGAPHPAPEAYRAKFTAAYEHRTITGGIGHNLPQEAPQAFARAVLDISGRAA
jgi:pimeloyl-ACP methyl ester carboxylesterase